MTGKSLFVGLAMGMLAMSSASYAADNHVVSQTDKLFSVEDLTIKIGDSVEFLNNDAFFHDVYSLSDLKIFDLGSYPAGDSKTVTFEEAGEVEVECAIHPSMFMVITVE